MPEVLGSGCKKLMSDGYSAYESYASSRADLVYAQCWSHVRRKFFEAKDYSPVECERVLAMIAKLFSIEKEKDDLLFARRTQSLPVVDELFEYLNQLWFEQVVDKTSLLGKAISYTVKREKELRQFLIHEDIPLSNNHVERVIRPVALGRKNWMFCWSEVGAKYAAIAYTLTQCCKLHGINPWEYLVDVLHRIDTHPAKEVHLLTPKNWKVQNFQDETRVS